MRSALVYLLFGCVFQVFGISCPEVLARLKAGNDRYVHDELLHPRRDSERREAIAAKQSPFAVIIGCSDSRVSPEILFDQGVGDLFVVRVAGNVIDSVGLDSIDYGALYLGAACVVVLGHENCGAVKAVLDGTTQDIKSVAKLIAPAVQEAKRLSSEDLLKSAIQENALRMRDYLLNSKVIKKLVQAKKVNVHAAYYNLETGVVEWLD